MAAQQLSTALSDGALALTCLVVLGTLTRRGRPALEAGGLGVAVVGAAAAAGAARYGLAPGLADVHRALSSLAGYAGVPLIGAGYLASVTRVGRPVLFAVGGGLVGAWALAVGGDQASTILGAVAMLTTIGVCAATARQTRRAWTGALGAVGVMVAGLAIGSSGPKLWWIERVDAFHVALAISVALLGVGLRAVDGAHGGK